MDWKKKKTRVAIWAKSPDSALKRAVKWIAPILLIIALWFWRRPLFTALLAVWNRSVAASPSPLLPPVVVIGVLAVFLLWKLPQWQVARSGAADGKRFENTNEARKTLAQIIGGVLVLASLYSSVQTANLSVQTLNLSREGQITDRFTKAIEQLGAVDSAGKPRLEVRLGGIYALERIAKDSERDHSVIMEVLTTYVRQHAGKRKEPLKPGSQSSNNANNSNDVRIDADIQAILSVLGRREVSYDKSPLDLSQTVLRGANLGGLNLSRANLRGADVSDANLIGANLSGANLSGANLSDADLLDANLSGAYLGGANLGGATLNRASLGGAKLFGANLSEADLSGANLGGANLFGANLGGADLFGANLGGANLFGANLSGASLTGVINLTQEQLDRAYGDKLTQLPKNSGLKIREYASIK